MTINVDLCVVIHLYKRVPLNSNKVYEKKNVESFRGGDQISRKDVGATNSGKSFVNVVKSIYKSGTVDCEANPAIVLDDDCLDSKDLTNSLLGRVKEFASLSNLKMVLTNEGFVDISVRYMGELWVLLEFASTKSKELFCDNVGVGSWFSKLKQASFDFNLDGRVVWVEVKGVPFKFWSGIPSKGLLRSGGNFWMFEQRKFQDGSLNCWRSPMKRFNQIMGLWKVTIRFNMREVKVAEVLEMNFDESIGPKVNFLDDLFGIYPLLNKNSKENKENVNEKDQSLEYPPGFTPNAEENDRNLNGDKSQKCNTEEVFDGRDRDSTNMGSKGDASESTPNAEENDRNVNGNKSQKCNTGEVFSGRDEDSINRGSKGDASESVCTGRFKESEDGEVVIMGDFNEVRHKSDRFGSIFNGQGADEFNSFIANAGLEEVPLGGNAFTWCHKSVTKMSNRFDKPIEHRVVVDMCYPRSLLIDQQEDLECMVTKEEVKKAVWYCGCNPSLIALISKIPDANKVNDFRPISLICSIYKIIAKILANQLVSVLRDIANEVQSAFIAERQILDGSFILNEVLQWCKIKKKRSLNFNVDFEKLYDSVRWDLLDDVLKKFGFRNKWCDWIQTYLKSSRGSILINGSPTEEFQFRKGLMQGDPLSSFLFILIMESLHLSFQWVVNAGLFMGIKLSYLVNLSHMFYADDAVFVGQWSDSNINTLIHVLDCFYLASGLMMNMSKSKIMGVHVEGGMVKHAASKLGCLTLNTPFYYLGSKVGGSMSQMQAWKEVINKSVLGSIPIFHMSIFESRRVFFTHWNLFTVNSLMVMRGSTIRKRLYGRMLLRRFMGKTEAWVRQNMQCLDLLIRILSEQGVNVLEFMRLNLGNGDMASFWNDNWSGGGVFKDLYLRLYALENSKSVNVCTKLSDPSMDCSFRRKTRGGAEQVQLDALMDLVSTVNLVSMGDRWVWTLESSGEFSVASLRKVIDEKRLLTVCSKTRWVEVLEHLFFQCNLTRQIARKISLWWNVNYEDVNSYDEWSTWMVSLRLVAESKLMFEGLGVKPRLVETSGSKTHFLFCILYQQKFEHVKPEHVKKDGGNNMNGAFTPRKGVGSMEKGKSFVDVLSGKNRSESMESESSTAIVLDDDCLYSKDLSKSLFGRVKEVASQSNLKKALINEGFDDLTIRYMGELWILLEFESVKSKDLFRDNIGAVSWFSVLRQASNDFMPEGRIVWAEVEGIPFKVWSRNTFNRIAAKWGELLDFDDQEDLYFHSKRLCIYTKLHSNIFENFKIVYRGHDKHSCGDDNDVNEVAETLFDDSSGQKKNHSVDPFRFYPLLNKNKDDMHINETKDEKSIKYPLGFTPEAKNREFDLSEENVRSTNVENLQQENDVEILDEQKDIHDVKGSNTQASVSASQKAKKDWVKELCVKNRVNFLALQETKMESIDLLSVKLCWGNLCFDQVHSDSVGNSRGILCMWDPNSFRKNNVTISDYFVIIRGVWLKTNVNLLIVVVYAPQDSRDKRMLWDYLTHVSSQWDGEVVMMGDFNEVRFKSDRFGSVFNVRGADVFNSCIANAGLVEVPLGGSAFTWSHKSASKMSKIDRFLISDGLMNTCPNINAITLERYLSDHRPILFRESTYDYGLIPFRFYHHWLALDGFDNFVIDSWRNTRGDKSNAMRNLMYKLKFLKVIDNGNATDDSVPRRLEVLNSIQNHNQIQATEATQKAKIKWSVEGDENVRFFHGMINKKRSQQNIWGVMIDGKWIEEPSRVKEQFFQYFRDRFDEPKDDQVRIDMCFPRSLSNEQKDDLECMVSMEEVKRAVWDYGTDKSPGPDGFSFDFYRHFWPTIDNEVFEAVKYFFIHTNFPIGCNSAFMALIPKIPDENMVKDFRPISLIGSINKIVAKILANRIVGVLGDIVNEMQYAFIAERQILEGPFILNEVMHWCKTKKKQALFFKVDFEKAYDTIRWDFLDDVLHKFGFGLKQGDPLSPFLFILIMESLHLSFQRVVDAGMYTGIKLCSSLNLSHLFYAGDVMFVGQWCDSNINILVHALECFHRASGLKMNMSKRLWEFMWRP
nr:RNA-directed DNA polymerase, eukaryota [Tanacetum cinerariifolium]